VSDRRERAVENGVAERVSAPTAVFVYVDAAFDHDGVDRIAVVPAVLGAVGEAFLRVCHGF